MDFSQIIGQKYLKSHLLKTIENDRIPHAQLFVGCTGSGILPIAIAYAQKVLCRAHDQGSQSFARCVSNIKNLAHPDLHFVYPVNSNGQVKKNPVSANFIGDWRKFVLDNPYASYFDWLKAIGIENKQGNISVKEAQEILATLALKSFDGGYKVMIIWMADNMNTECSNKILKIIEEPPAKTLLLLLTDAEESILSTIRSRCQKLDFPKLSEENIATELVKNYGILEQQAKRISHNAEGDINRAIHIINNDSDDIIFEEWFISWVRTAFKAKGNKAAINELLAWSEDLATKGRETQKKFISYCLEVFRQSLLKNYKAESLLFYEFNDQKFSLDKFAPFVHQNNIFEITTALEEASHHISRNGNGKIIFTDLSIKLTRLLHKKESS